jgi:phage-related protein
MFLTEFLTYVSGPGINAMVGVVISFAVDEIPGFKAWFAGLDPRAKRLITFVLSLVVPVLASLALGIISDVPLFSKEMGDLLWRAVQSGFLSFTTSQAAHVRKMMKKPIDIFK